MSGFARFDLVKDFLQRDIDLLVREMVPGARAKGRIFEAKNPRRADRTAGSFVIWRQGVPGSWKDYASGDQGDVVDLVAFLKGWERREVLAWAEARYGIRRMGDDERRRLAAKAKTARIAEAEAEAAADIRKRQWAADIFEAAVPRIRGTLVETYFASRGLELRAMPWLEHQWFRFHPALEWWRGAVRDERGRKIEAGPQFPALVSAMVDRRGTMRAIHCTFLAEDGRGKAPVEKPKLMFPATAGLVIRVARGDSRMTPEAAAKHGVIGPALVGEGVEDAATFALAMPELRTFAAGSLAGLLHLPDLPCVESWLVARDNDWGKPQAAELFERAMARIRDFGKPAVAIAATGDAKDFNDMVR